MEEEQVPPYIKGEKRIVVVGNVGCGKTSMIASFTSESPVDIVKTVPIRKTINFGRDRVEVALHEERADPHFSFVRMLDYRRTNAAFVCFAFNDAKSIRSIPTWIDEVRLNCPYAVLMVVGCKLDIKHKTSVSAKDWMDLEKAIVPYRYLECSAKTGEGVLHLVRVLGIALLNQQQNSV